MRDPLTCSDCGRPVWHYPSGVPASRCAFHLDRMQWKQRKSADPTDPTPEPKRIDYTDNCRRLGHKGCIASPPAYTGQPSIRAEITVMGSEIDALRTTAEVVTCNRVRLIGPNAGNPTFPDGTIVVRCGVGQLASLMRGHTVTINSVIIHPPSNIRRT